jgi:arginyl-tRNA synthetase
MIVFDFDEALNFEGETGPYLQYSCVRLNSIFRKLEEREEFTLADVSGLISGPLRLELLGPEEMADFWDLVFFASQLEEEILHSLHPLEFSHLAKFSFSLCQKSNAYYHRYPILAEENRDIKNIRISVIYCVKKVLETALSLMGITVPEKM